MHRDAMGILKTRSDKDDEITPPPFASKGVSKWGQLTGQTRVLTSSLVTPLINETQLHTAFSMLYFTSVITLLVETSRSYHHYLDTLHSEPSLLLEITEIFLLLVNLKIKVCKTIILPVVLYGFETWSLTEREEHRLQVSENSVLRRIFGPKREDDGAWRKLHNDELKNLYSSPSIVRVIKSRRMRWAGHVAHMDGTRGVHRVLVGKPEGKRPLVRPRRRLEDNVRWDLWEIGVEGDRVQWRALVNSVMNLRVRYAIYLVS
ncbi:Putative uncharacterized transposon-derived protein F52C9.6 [Zootermopsis nevadensis]|uniref:Uncharacterized transposon-derived protein F52C9.6 n=1 Tax=Zootermopsis nevadensis TaxID=136037 RepID=A0A067R7T6_ZOONE|nr:Putative uncharacterized transposon-derived protein F52C9.6 [Zootermopsis nevadensis]